jgi:hypothetical protein
MERGKEFFGRRRSETERRKILARTYYDFEVECREQGWAGIRLHLLDVQYRAPRVEACTRHLNFRFIGGYHDATVIYRF